MFFASAFVVLRISKCSLHWRAAMALSGVRLSQEFVRQRHVNDVARIMGGWYDMRRYVETFGALDPWPPSADTFCCRSFVPPQFMMEEFFGDSVYDGLRACVVSMSQRRGKGWAFWSLSEAFNRGEVQNATVWVSNAFSKDNMMLEPGPNDSGRWYPCIVSLCIYGEVVIFCCPRLALDGTRCWVAHWTRIHVFVPELVPAVSPGLGRAESVSPEDSVAASVKKGGGEDDYAVRSTGSTILSPSSASTASSSSLCISRTESSVVEYTSSRSPGSVCSPWLLVDQDSTSWPSPALSPRSVVSVSASVASGTPGGGITESCDDDVDCEWF